MTTRHLAGLVTGVLILSVLVPVGLSLWLAHRQVEQKFIEELNTYSSGVALRANKVASQGKLALKQMERFEGEPCSNAHLLAMRRVSYSNRYIQEVLYLENNVPACSSLEQKSHAAALPEPGKIFRGGYRAWLTAQNDLGIKRYMVALGTDRYIVMIDPASFIDVIPFGSSQIDAAIIGEAHNIVIASSDRLKPEIIQQLQQAANQHMENNGTLYNIQPFPEMRISIVTWSSALSLQKNWYRQALIWLPVGLVIGLLSAAFILRILRRIQSPHHRLQDAIQNRDIKVHYQPIVSLRTGKVVGAEALARWPQTDGSYLSPDIFIALAEETGLSESLSHLIIDTVFEEMGKWLQQHPGLHISINLESSDLTSQTLPSHLSKLLNRYHVAPSQIALELTEREFADPKTCAPIITQYRKAGHAIYIDDFGTGYSSLSYLQNLEVDILKIDKSFVDALEYKNVTTHIIEMAKTLKLEMVAEGIETPRQESWLREHGVQYGQGWLYSKALPKSEFILWAEQHR
ncbi:EAL domain-containing protein [Citrobacter sp. R56]|uniref:EAL domain-containing protein n=1 Tax=Citrobacter sp. R56 TaxID=1573676 RepID=UPI00193C1CAC|nr:EAL domain-containing protein [Citrobacter sp. R56]QRG78118.1 EAL domain-containing protein [Citrobacter sp. R56]